MYIVYKKLDKNLYIFYVDYDDVRTFTIAYSNLIYIFMISCIYFLVAESEMMHR